PLTDNLPKALVPLAGKPILEHLINKLKRSGFTQIVINVHHFADMIIEFLKRNNNFGIEIYISDERNCLLDTGGGIKHAAKFLQGNEPFLVHNIDIISNADLNDIYEKHCAENSFATLPVSTRQATRCLLFNADNKLCGWQNKLTGELKWSNPQFPYSECTAYAFSGIHVISPEIFNCFDNYPEIFSIIDFYLSQSKTKDISAYVSQQLRLIDVGKRETLLRAEKEYSDLI
ncbi:MAG: NTP transferase domain-containing protein, partial [Prevotellaceae bacterium]|nr:NTP transferase domain-containing protein [Prevotellaceae bacterium]